jgi:hypothetical protein
MQALQPSGDDTRIRGLTGDSAWNFRRISRGSASASVRSGDATQPHHAGIRRRDPSTPSAIRLIERTARPRADCPFRQPRRVGTRWMRSIAAVRPPAPRPDKLDLELRLCPLRDREDALQEAWLAALEGRNPARAVNTFAQRERRYRKRETVFDCVPVRPLKLRELRDARAARIRESRRATRTSSPHSASGRS